MRSANKLIPFFVFVSQLENIPHDDDRRQTIIQRDEDELDDMMGVHSDVDNLQDAESAVFVSNTPTSPPSSAVSPPLTPSTSRSMQRRTSAAGIVGKLRNVILDKRRLSSGIESSANNEVQDDASSTGSSVMHARNDSLQHNDSSSMDSTTYPNIRNNVSSPSRQFHETDESSGR
jgi:hypothetical protein